MNQGERKDKNILENILKLQNEVTSRYNDSTNQCSTPVIRSAFLGLLNEEHLIQANVFDELHKRGWLPTPEAEIQQQQQIQQEFKQEQ